MDSIFAVLTHGPQDLFLIPSNLLLILQTNSGILVKQALYCFGSGVSPSIVMVWSFGKLND